jgi:hypothetical protein
LESERSTVTSTYEGEWAGYEGATYRRFTCSDKSSIEFTDHPPNEQSGYTVYKAISEPVTEGSRDVPAEGIYEIRLWQGGYWLACHKDDLATTYGLAEQAIQIGAPIHAGSDLTNPHEDPEVRHLNKERSHMIGSYERDVTIVGDNITVANKVHEHLRVDWDICRVGSSGCTAAR